MKQQYGKLLLLGAAGLLLTACGGGGGGGGSSTPTATSVGYTGSTTAVTISDQTTADSIAAATISSAMNMDLSASLPALKAGSSVTNSNELADVAKRLLDRALSLPKPSDGSTLAGVTNNYTYYCSVSGNIVYSETYADPNSNTPGDSFNITANTCNDGGSYVIDGGFSGVLLSYTDSNNMSARFSFSNLREDSTYTTDYTLLNGGITMTISYNYSTGIEGTSITGDALLYDMSLSGVTYTQALTQFSLVDSYDGSTGTTTVDHDYTFYSTAIGGFVQVETTTPIVFASGAYYPYQGVVVITGASGAKVRLTAQPDATNVYIEYDINPIDGVYESSQTVTWSYLASL